MSCPVLPEQHVREILQKTRETGNEHVFGVCADGSVTDPVEGQKTKAETDSTINQCDLDNGPVHLVHTHPNGVKRLSDKDREAAAHEDIASVCVAVSDGIVCESVDRCEPEVEE